MGQRVAFLAAVLVALGIGWGLTQPLSKIAVSQGYRAFGLVFWQMSLGAVVMGAVLVLTRRRLPMHPEARRFYAILALIGTVIPNSASYQAAVHLPAGVIAILLSLVPMLAFPMALALGVDRFGWGRLLGLACGLAGVSFIILPEASLPERAMVAFIPLGLVAPLFYAAEGSFVARWGMHGLDPFQALAGASIFGAAMTAPLAVASGQFIDPRPPWGVPDAAVVLSATVHVCVYAGYVCLVSRAGAVFAAQVSYLVTGFGVLWSMALLGESYSGWVWAALFLMFAGLFLVQPRPGPLVPDPATGKTAG